MSAPPKPMRQNRRNHSRELPPPHPQKQKARAIQRGPSSSIVDYRSSGGRDFSRAVTNQTSGVSTPEVPPDYPRMRIFPRVCGSHFTTTKNLSSRPKQPDAFSSHSFLECVGPRSGGILATCQPLPKPLRQNRSNHSRELPPPHPQKQKARAQARAFVPILNHCVFGSHFTTTKNPSSRPEQPDAFSSHSFLECVGLRSGGILATCQPLPKPLRQNLRSLGCRLSAVDCRPPYPPTSPSPA